MFKKFEPKKTNDFKYLQDHADGIRIQYLAVKTNGKPISPPTWLDYITIDKKEDPSTALREAKKIFPNLNWRVN